MQSSLAIRMLTGMIEYGLKIEEEIKAIQSDRKENVQGTNSEGKEARIQINDSEQKEKINIIQSRQKKQEFKKNPGNKQKTKNRGQA